VHTELHPAYVLHRRRYRETSLMLECLSAEHGRVGIVARGALRARKRGGDSMQPFQKYKIAWFGRSDLHTLTKLEPAANVLKLTGERLFSGFYVNELVMRLTGRHDPNSDLFTIYEQTLQSLARDAVPIEPVLRRFEKRLLDACGYGLQLAVEAENGAEIEASREYHYVVEEGPMRAHDGGRGVTVDGETLLALAANGELHEPQLQQAKKLMRFVLHHYIGDRPLASRALFRNPMGDASPK
jgi:DNA repair protein RecO (recombination protein O)